MFGGAGIPLPPTAREHDHEAVALAPQVEAIGSADGVAAAMAVVLERLSPRSELVFGHGVMPCVVTPTHAQTTANGPYYATPSWDQTLPSSTRFIVLSNFGGQAVLDRETGLVWEKSPATSLSSWSNAAIHCNNLNVGNRKGWRLPTIQELPSLVDGDPANTAAVKLPSGHPFTISTEVPYWSGTTNANNADVAWVLFFFNGAVIGSGVGNKGSTFLSWCVRGGQGVDPQ